MERRDAVAQQQLEERAGCRAIVRVWQRGKLSKPVIFEREEAHRVIPVSSKRSRRDAVVDAGTEVHRLQALLEEAERRLDDAVRAEHASRGRPTVTSQVLALLHAHPDGTLSARDVYEELGLRSRAVAAVTLCRLTERGEVRRVSPGRYGATREADLRSTGSGTPAAVPTASAEPTEPRSQEERAGIYTGPFLPLDDADRGRWARAPMRGSRDW